MRSICLRAASLSWLLEWSCDKYRSKWFQRNGAGPPLSISVVKRRRSSRGVENSNASCRQMVYSSVSCGSGMPNPPRENNISGANGDSPRGKGTLPLYILEKSLSGQSFMQERSEGGRPERRAAHCKAYVTTNEAPKGRLPSPYITCGQWRWMGSPW